MCAKPPDAHPPCRGLGLLALAAGLAAAAAGLGGCAHSDVPRAQNHPVSDQPKARALQHWDVLAEDVAERIAAVALPALSTGREAVAVPLGAAEPSGVGVGAFHLQASSATPFHQAFSSLLLTRLVNKGVPMATLPAEGERTHGRIRLEVQVVEHAGLPLNMPTHPLTLLAAGLSVLRGMYLYPPSEFMGAAMGVGAAYLADEGQRELQGRAAGGPTRTEVLVSTTVLLGQRIVGRTSDIYYIEGADARLFVEPPPPPPPPPVKTWKVTG